jgi:hypothetical protein
MIEEELIAIKAKGVPIVTELIRAYQETVESPYFQKLARILERARVEEKMAIGSAVEAANRQKDAVIKKKDAEIPRLRLLLDQGSGDN